jgi:hypothetical protein
MAYLIGALLGGLAVWLAALRELARSESELERLGRERDAALRELARHYDERELWQRNGRAVGGWRSIG